MSLEMAHKVILPPKKNYIPQFLKQRDINSYLILACLFSCLKVHTKTGLFEFASLMRTDIYVSCSPDPFTHFVPYSFIISLSINSLRQPLVPRPLLPSSTYKIFTHCLTFLVVHVH
jgi:hypothetical protein